jgi:hypothetical protein
MFLNMYDKFKLINDGTYQMPYGNVVRVGGGCGPLYI